MPFVEQKYKLYQKQNGIKNEKSHTETNLVPQTMEESKVKSKTAMIYRSQKKNKTFFVPFILPEDIFFKDLCLISMNIVLNTLSEYTCFYISKNVTS